MVWARLEVSFMFVAAKVRARVPCAMMLVSCSVVDTGTALSPST
jgi:hypothetical protein